MSNKGIVLGVTVEFLLSDGVYQVVKVDSNGERILCKLIPVSENCSIKEDFWVSSNILHLRGE